MQTIAGHTIRRTLLLTLPVLWNYPQLQKMALHSRMPINVVILQYTWQNYSYYRRLIDGL